MKQGIYVKCEHCLFSKLNLIILLIVTVLLAGITYISSLNQIFTELSAYLIYSFTSILAIFCLYYLQNIEEPNYIYLDDDEIRFKEKSQNEPVCLKFEKLDHFETRFSEIIFCTKEAEKVVMQLNKIKDEKKRWEIKEFLKLHIKQLKDNKTVLLVSA